MVADKRLCALDAPKRNHYFYGKLLDEQHLRLEQEYLNRKRWMLSRLALGSGVLCGLQLTKDEKHVLVNAGAAIDQYGREIVVPAQVRIDVSKISVDCRTSRARRDDESSVYLCLCYQECNADFMPALVTDCRTRDCAPSTIVESYCIEVRADAPPSVAAEDEALCKALREGKDGEEKRRLINAALQRDCACGEQHGCIALAKVDIDADGVVTAIDLAPQQRVYGNDMLFKMLLCLHSGSQGPKGEDGGPGPEGPAGVGLFPDLPKILDIAWQHNTTYFLGEGPTNTAPGSFLRPFFANGALLTLEDLKQRLTAGTDPPLFTLYFNRVMSGIDDQTFTLRLQFELAVFRQNALMRPGFYIELPLAGTILQAEPSANVQTPHTHEPYTFAATFVPRPEVFASLLPVVLVLQTAASKSADEESLALVTLQVKLKGDFIFAPGAGAAYIENQVLDADNVGGQVGIDRTRGAPIRGGKNPSGNFTHGGDFESWVRVALAHRSVDAPTPDPARFSMLASALRNRPEELPLNINFASADALERVGFSSAQTARILELRRQQFFVDDADLMARAEISRRRLRDVGDRILL